MWQVRRRGKERREGGGGREDRCSFCNKLTIGKETNVGLLQAQISVPNPF